MDPPPLSRETDRHLLKHYLPTTSLVGGNNYLTSKQGNWWHEKLWCKFSPVEYYRSMHSSRMRTARLLTVFCSIWGSGGSKGGGARGTRTPRGPNSFNFMQFMGKLSKSYVGAPPWGVGAPSSGKSWIRHCEGRGVCLGGMSTQAEGWECLPGRMSAWRGVCPEVYPSMQWGRHPPCG